MKRYRAKLILKYYAARTGVQFTALTHVKLMDENGEYVKFAKHTPALLEALNNMEIDIEMPDDVVV